MPYALLVKTLLMLSFMPHASRVALLVAFTLLSFSTNKLIVMLTFVCNRITNDKLGIYRWSFDLLPANVVL